MTTSAKRWKAPFFAIWTGQAFSLLGSNLVQFALVWWLTKTTGSATVLAMATLMALLPQIFLSPLAGALVDRWNRRTVMIMADTLIALVTLVLIGLFAMDAAKVWHVYLIMLIRSGGAAFHWPAMSASTSLMVPKEQLSRIAGLNQTLFGVMGILSPPLGALLMDVLPMQGMLAIDIVTASIAVTPLLFVHIPQPERRTTPDGEQVKQSVWQDMREGLRYVRAWPGLLIILLMATAINFLFNPAFSLLPLLVKDHFGGQALQLGWIQSAWGIGVVLGGLTLSVWGGFKRKLNTSLAGLIGMGLGTAIIGVSPAGLFVLAIGAMFVAGVMNPITNGPINALLQSSVTPEMQGRVFTLVGASASAISPLSLALAGPLSDLVGVRVWYVAAGTFCALMGVIGFFIPALAEMENGSQAHAPTDEREVVEAAPSGPKLAAETGLDR